MVYGLSLVQPGLFPWSRRTELSMKLATYEKCVRYEEPKEFLREPLCAHARRIKIRERVSTVAAIVQTSRFLGHHLLQL